MIIQISYFLSIPCPLILKSLFVFFVTLSTNMEMLCELTAKMFADYLGAMGNKYVRKLLLKAVERYSTEIKKILEEIHCTGHLKIKGPGKERNDKILSIMQKKIKIGDFL